jgi:hypothetical protein
MVMTGGVNAMNGWKWQDQPRRVPVAVLSGRSHINYRHLALIREQLEAEPVPEGTAIIRSVQKAAAEIRSAVRTFVPASLADGSR